MKKCIRNQFSGSSHDVFDGVLNLELKITMVKSKYSEHELKIKNSAF